MAAVWPPSLPQKFLLGTTDERQPAVARFTVDAGPAKVRRVFPSATRHVQWKLPPITQAQRETLDAFFVSTLQEGAVEFDHLDPSTGLSTQYRFLSPLRYSAAVNAQGRLWDVTTQVEILPGDTSIVQSPPALASLTFSHEGNNATSLSVAMPATRPDGDLYLFFVTADSPTQINGPGGITLIGRTESTLNGGWFGYRIGSSEPASYTFSHGSSEQWSGVVARVRGFRLGAPISQAQIMASTGNPAIGELPAMSPPDARVLMLAFCGLDSDHTSIAAYQPYAWTPLGNQRSGAVSGNVTLMAASKVQTVQGNQGQLAFAALGNTRVVSGVAAIKPAA